MLFNEQKGQDFIFSPTAELRTESPHAHASMDSPAPLVTYRIACGISLCDYSTTPLACPALPTAPSASHSGPFGRGRERLARASQTAHRTAGNV